MQAQIQDHPFLKYKDRPIKRYIQNIDNPCFENNPVPENPMENPNIKPYIRVKIHIKHFGIDSDGTELYIPSLAPDIKTDMEASNLNWVDILTQKRVEIIPAEYKDDIEISSAHYPDGSMPEYDFWIMAVKNIPNDNNIFDLLEEQMLLFANRGSFDIY